MRPRRAACARARPVKRNLPGVEDEEAATCGCRGLVAPEDEQRVEEEEVARQSAILHAAGDKLLPRGVSEELWTLMAVSVLYPRQLDLTLQQIMQQTPHWFEMLARAPFSMFVLCCACLYACLAVSGVRTLTARRQGSVWYTKARPAARAEVPRGHQRASARADLRALRRAGGACGAPRARHRGPLDRARAARNVGRPHGAPRR